MYLVNNTSTNHSSWSLAMHPPVADRPENSLVDLCVSIICGLGLMLATVAVVENPLLVVSVVLMGTLMLTALKISRSVFQRSWSPFNWVRWPQWRMPSLWHRPEPSYSSCANYWHSSSYYPTYIYSPQPSRAQDGWMRNEGRAPGVPTQA